MKTTTLSTMGRPSTTASSRISAVGSTRQSVAGSANSRAPGAGGPSKIGSRNSIVPANSLGARTTMTSDKAASRPSSFGARSNLVTTASSRSSMAGTASKRISETPITDAKKTSRVLAPTASSLAKRQSVVRPPTLDSHPLVPRSGTKSPDAKQALGAITNAAEPRSPGRIFSKPISMSAAALMSPNPTKIPSPIRKSLATFSPRADGDQTARGENAEPSLLVRGPQPRAAGPTRKPRISRSKVIAKLGAQRAATSDSSTRPVGIKASAARTRSSMGTAVAARKSLGTGRKSTSGGDNGVVISAKKKARQSEYARRRSQVASRAATAGTSTGSGEMDVDP
jgi:hypothetical protein